MKNLKTYSQLFESNTTLTPEQVEWLNSCTQGTWTLNPQTGLVDVKGDFDCSDQGLTDFKGVRFGIVGLNFYCDHNRLISLEGSPRMVGGSFYCHKNRLTTLEGAPQKVVKSFRCDNNHLPSLEGAPQYVGGGFHCGYNQLTSLEGAPQKVGSGFYCDGLIMGIIFSIMDEKIDYLQAVKALWNNITLEEQTLLYRPEFDWVSAEERRKLDLVKAYQGFKDML
jgi:hypothetical protein